MQLRNKQDFWSGVMFVALGVGFALGATSYSMGTAARMGPGYFPFGDTRALTRLIRKVERDGTFRRKLVAHGRRLRPLFRPAAERAAWARLLEQA